VRAYGPAKKPRRFDAMEELVFTLLSQHTSDANSMRAYENLRRALPTWDAVAKAKPEAIAEAITVGGLSKVKAPRIKAALGEIRERCGSWDLSFLREMELAGAKAWLRELPGVGPKTAACVLLFALDVPALPVDTHVYRVAKRLGLIDAKVSAEESHEVLEGMLKPSEVLPFHMYLITHGRRVCKAQKPKCAECVLEPRCPGSELRSKL